MYTSLKDNAINHGLKFVKQEGYEHQKVMQYILEEYNKSLLDMTEDQKYEFCHDVADKIEELI